MPALLLVEFLVFLKRFIPDRQEYDELVKYLEEIFDNCDESYKKSPDFKQLITSTSSSISQDEKKLHVYIAHLVCDLQAHVKHPALRGDGREAKKGYGDRNPGSGSERLPQKRARRGNEDGDVGIDLPGDGIIRDNYNRKEASSAVVREDHCRGHSSTRTTDVSTLNSAPKLVALQPAKIDSVSSAKRADVHPVATSTSHQERTVKPSCSKEPDCMSVADDKMSVIPQNRDEERNILLSFLACLKSLIQDPQLFDDIRKYIKRLFSQCDESFRKSSDFRQLVRSAKSAVSNDKERLFPHLLDFTAKLKSHNKNSRGPVPGELLKQKANDDKGEPDVRAEVPNVERVTENNAESPYNEEVTSSCSPSVSPAKKPKRDLDAAKSEKIWIVLERNATKARSKPESTSEQKAKVKSSGIHRKVSVKSAVTSKKKPKAEAKPSFREDQDDGKIFVSERQITELENHLGVLRDKIEKLKEREMSLDDLDKVNSCYIYQYKLERKFVEVWNKLCELIGRPKATGRPTEKRFRFDGTRFPEINKKIRRFIDSKKNFFPDLNDITEIIIQVNKKKKLHLSSKSVEEISKVAFQDVGDLLKDRRWNDFLITFGCRLTDHVDLNDDPALTDPELEAKLELNRSEGKKRLDEIFRKYTREQEAEELANQSRKEKEEESSRSPTNGEEEQVRAPEHHPVPYEAVGHQVEDNCTGINMEGNEGLLNVLKLTTDEDKEDVRLDEDNEKDERTSAL